MSKPTVAIVGRPNVGKSTLFNRIIRSREAIVDDDSGTTRDRKYADAEWEGIQFTLIDTGGYVPKSSDVIEEGVSKQVRAAIMEADIILFIVDCLTGITDIDGEVARIIKKSGKNYLLAVNKVDSIKREPYAAEFIRLGLGEPLMISALVGRGIGDLLSSIVRKVDRNRIDRHGVEVSGLRLAVIGRPNVGKSTFINVILGEERLLVTELPGTTRDAIDVRIRYKGRDIILIDTAGLRRRSRVKESVEYYSTLRARRVIEQCDVACVFIDGSEGFLRQDLRLIDQATSAKKGTLLVINKWDIVRGDRERFQKLEQEIEMKLQGLSYIPFIRISCKEKLRVRKVLELALRIYQERNRRISSSDLNRLIQDVHRNFQPPAIQGKRIQIKYGTQIATAPPRFVLFTNYPKLVNDSYKRFIENKIRDRFGFEGVPLTFYYRKK